VSPTDPLRPVLDRLLGAYQRGDRDAFVATCSTQAALLVERGADWSRVPMPMRDDREATEFWVQLALTTAQVLDELGHPQPLALLTGEKDSPILTWQRALARATRLAEAGRWDESDALIVECLASMEGSSGPAVDDLYPKSVGLLGANALYRGKLEDARTRLEEALAWCERVGDAEGSWIHRENLRVVRAVEAVQRPDPEGERLLAVREHLVRAQELTDQGMFAASLAAIERALSAIADSGGEYRAKAHGLAGTNYFRLGDLAAGQAATERALAESERRHDGEGVRIYRENLKVIAAAGKPEGDLSSG